MCLASSPNVTTQAAPPPSSQPAPLASPYTQDLAGSLSQLRIGGRAPRKGAPKQARPDNSATLVTPTPYVDKPVSSPIPDSGGPGGGGE